MSTILLLTCTVLVPSGSTGTGVRISVRNITEKQERFTITTNRAFSYFINVDHMTTDLTITSPQTDTGY